MKGEIVIAGVYFPSLLVLAIVAIVLLMPVRRLLDRLGFYRWMGSRPLADLALFVLITGLLVFVTMPGTAGNNGIFS